MAIDRYRKRNKCKEKNWECTDLDRARKGNKCKEKNWE
jgi:hypothetical protein